MPDRPYIPKRIRTRTTHTTHAKKRRLSNFFEIIIISQYCSTNRMICVVGIKPSPALTGPITKSSTYSLRSITITRANLMWNITKSKTPPTSCICNTIKLQTNLISNITKPSTSPVHGIIATNAYPTCCIIKYATPRITSICNTIKFRAYPICHISIPAAHPAYCILKSRVSHALSNPSQI
jgi:hypothetical protein